MKKLALAAALALMATPVLAGGNHNGGGKHHGCIIFCRPRPTVPEMDAGAGIAALLLIGGLAAIGREKTRRK